MFYLEIYNNYTNSNSYCTRPRSNESFVFDEFIKKNKTKWIDTYKYKFLRAIIWVSTHIYYVRVPIWLLFFDVTINFAHTLCQNKTWSMSMWFTFINMKENFPDSVFLQLISNKQTNPNTFLQFQIFMH